MNGLEFLKILRAFSPELPVIVMVEAATKSRLRPLSLERCSRWSSQSLGLCLRGTVSHAVGLKRAQQDMAPEFLTRRGDALAPIKITATDAKNQMGRVLETVMQGGVVLITKHEAPKAAVIPMAEYEKFSRATEARLNALSSEFDAILARMQTPKSRAGMQAAFDASPERLAEAAVAFAKCLKDTCKQRDPH